VFKLVLCHRIQARVGNHALHDHWRQARSALVRELQPALRYDSYGQTHQSSRLDFVYLSLLFSRSRLVTSLLAVKKLSQTPPVGSNEHWDVTDEFEYSSQESLVQAIMSEAGAAAAGRLLKDQASFVRQTAVVITEEFVDAPDPAPQPLDLRVDFFLRRRPELTRDEMLAYWGETHKQLVLSLQSPLEYRAYNQLHVRSALDFTTVTQRFGGGNTEEYDGVAELCFTNQWVLAKGIFNPRTELANFELVKNETGFIDHQRSVLVYGNHYRIFPR
jgi:hypothetical protein